METSSNQNETRKDRLQRYIQVSFDNLLLVWDPKNELPPDFVASTLGRFDTKVEIRDQWTFLPTFKASYKGVIAEFRTRQAVRDAARELAVLCRSVMAIPLNRFLDVIIASEMAHPRCGRQYTKIYVACKKYARGETRRAVNNILHLFGNVREVVFYNEEQYHEQCILCEVTYEYAAQAYAAKLYLDGMTFTPIIEYTVVVEEGAYERDILSFVRCRMMDLIDESKMVPLRW